MGEYIEREALIAKMRRMPIPKQAGSGYTWLDNCSAGINAAIREVKSFPAADVVSVVRCKDCIYCVRGNYAGAFICRATTNPNFVSPDHFCSYGTRKGEL